VKRNQREKPGGDCKCVSKLKHVMDRRSLGGVKKFQTGGNAAKVGRSGEQKEKRKKKTHLAQEGRKDLRIGEHFQ